MIQAEHGVITQLAREVKILREQLIANTQINGLQTNHIQVLVNKVEALEAELAQQQQINLNLAQRLETLEASIVPGRAGVH